MGRTAASLRAAIALSVEVSVPTIHSHAEHGANAIGESEQQGGHRPRGDRRGCRGSGAPSRAAHDQAGHLKQAMPELVTSNFIHRRTADLYLMVAEKFSPWSA